MDYTIRQLEVEDLASLVTLCKNHAEYEQAKYNTTNKLELLEKAIFAENPKLFCYVIDSETALAGYFS